jgi:hypothetical protein
MAMPEPRSMRRRYQKEQRKNDARDHGRYTGMNSEARSAL